jgi:preprotein translocase subunit SecG
MHGILVGLHVLIGVVLILVVLIQAGRSGGFSSLMGGGGDALFSTTSQQSGLRKATIIIAVLFMATSLGLTLLSSRETNESVFQRAMPALPPVNMPAQAPAQSGAKDTGALPEKAAVPALPKK